jgi:leucyl aminopeptidase
MAQVQLTTAPALGIEAGALVVPVFERDMGRRAQGVVAALDRALRGALLRAAAEERFRGKPDQLVQLHTLGTVAARRVLLVGIGADEGEAGAAERLRMAAGTATRAALKGGADRLAFAMPAGLDAADSARAITEGALLGAYRFGRYKTRNDEAAEARSIAIALPAGAPRAAAGRGLELGRRIAAAVAWARDRVNEAPMHCTPSRLARAAQTLARSSGLRCEVRGPKEIAALGMGMFLGVTRGSAEEPRLVHVSYAPRGGARRRPLVLVGKAITFDSGGLSLKPTESMVTMNGDMAGSAAVLAAMQVVAALAPPFPVHALLGACENMPGGRAYKPSDVLTAYDGKTVEVTNTDAEGRLVLSDVLAWAVDALDPAAVVDVATLTGACVVALGNYTVGAFGPDGVAIDAVLAAARRAGEDVWRLPLTERVKDTLQSDVADLRNTGERWGGAIAAAHFLHEFTGDVPWAHLDIAGPAHAAKERGYVAKGGTGVGVRTLVELVRGWDASAVPAARGAGRGRARSGARRGR